MRKRKQQTKLSRSTAHRKALLKNLAQELIRHGKIRTTLPKAKALRIFVEPLITHARKGANSSENYLSSVFYDQTIVRTLLSEIGPRYEKEQRPGGYTRVIKLGYRQGDGAEEAIIELVSSKPVTAEKESKQHA